MRNFEFEMITLCPFHTDLERWCHMNNNSSLLVPHEVHPLICFNHNISSSEIHFVVLLSSRISGYLLNSSFQEPDFTVLQGTDTVHTRKLSRKLSVTALVFYLFFSFFCTLHTTSWSIARHVSHRQDPPSLMGNVCSCMTKLTSWSQTLSSI